MLVGARSFLLFADVLSRFWLGLVLQRYLGSLYHLVLETVFSARWGTASCAVIGRESVSSPLACDGVSAHSGTASVAAGLEGVCFIPNGLRRCFSAFQ